MKQMEWNCPQTGTVKNTIGSNQSQHPEARNEAHPMHDSELHNR